MNFGQIVSQMPFVAGPETGQLMLSDVVAVEGQVTQVSPFAEVLHDISPQGNSKVCLIQYGAKALQIGGNAATESSVESLQKNVTIPIDVKQLLLLASDAEQVAVAEAIEPEIIPVDVTRQQLFEVNNPQNVVIAVSGAQTVPLLQFEGRMPESQVAAQHDMASRDLSFSSSKAVEKTANVITEPSFVMTSQQQSVVSPAPAMPGRQLEVATAAPQLPAAATDLAKTTLELSGRSTSVVSLTAAEPTLPNETAPLQAMEIVTPAPFTKNVSAVPSATFIAKPENPATGAPIDMPKAAMDASNGPAKEVPVPETSAASEKSNIQIAVKSASSTPLTALSTMVSRESTPAVTSVPLVSGQMPATSEVSETAAVASPKDVTRTVPMSSATVTVMAEAASLAGPALTITGQQSKTDLIPAVAVNSPEAASRGAAAELASNTSATTEENNTRTVVIPALTTPAAASPVVAPGNQANRIETLLDAYYQTSTRPAAAAPSVPQPQSIMTAEISLPLSSVSTAPTAAAQSTPFATISESTSTSHTAPRVERLTTVLPVAAESAEAVMPAEIVQSAATTPRVIVTPSSSRIPEKVVENVNTLRQVATCENRMPEQSTAVTSSINKEPAMLDSGENSTGNGNEGTGKNLNGQAHLMAAQQNKVEQPAPISVPVTQEMRETATAKSMENAVQQVKEHLVGRDYKTGTEQVIIRLNPENMGELKLNLRMENQQLKVEIIAENSMIRDTLLKNSELLRETLAKQNIKMDSFDVTTSGNGTADSGRGQASWRELTQQRQHAAWMPDGGYRPIKPEAPAMAAYQRKSEHTMVDLHY
jgi:flagellar hook-length control protein FliK